MKIDKKKLFKDIDYLGKLSDYEKDFIFRFELREKYGLTPLGQPPLTSDELRRFENKRYRYRADIMNTPYNKIIHHYYSLWQKPRYGPQDYPCINPSSFYQEKIIV